MISAEEAQWIIQAFIAANNPSMKDCDPSIWQMSINSAMTSSEPPKRIDPTFRECQAATLRLINRGEKFPGPGNVAAEVELGRIGDSAVRKARIEHVIGNRVIVPEGLGDEPLLEAEWRRRMIRAVGDGLTLDEAKARAWSEIHRAPPPELPEHPRSIHPQLRKA